jgi:hypothetical protein
MAVRGGKPFYIVIAHRRVPWTHFFMDFSFKSPPSSTLQLRLIIDLWMALKLAEKWLGSGGEGFNVARPGGNSFLIGQSTQQSPMD